MPAAAQVYLDLLGSRVGRHRELEAITDALEIETCLRDGRAGRRTVRPAVLYLSLPSSISAARNIKGPLGVSVF